MSSSHITAMECKVTTGMSLLGQLKISCYYKLYLDSPLNNIERIQSQKHKKLSYYHIKKNTKKYPKDLPASKMLK